MKKNVVLFVLSVLLINSFASCTAIHSGYMNNSAALSQANFSYVQRNVEGVSTATYILGIGGLAKETLVNSAKLNLMDEALIKDNQAFVNTTVNFRNSYYLGVLIIVTCTVTADVIQFY
jgi:hypothetical protein